MTLLKNLSYCYGSLKYIIYYGRYIKRCVEIQADGYTVHRYHANITYWVCKRRGMGLGAVTCVVFSFREEEQPETQMHHWLSWTHPPTESKAQHQRLPTFCQGSRRGRRVCQRELCSHSVLRRLWGKWSCFTSHRDGTYASSLQEHQRCRPFLFTGLSSPVSTLDCRSTWSLDGACRAPLLAFCLVSCREAPGIGKH